MNRNRHQADSGDKYALYFKYLHEKMAEYHIQQQHTYNMDEKGFLIGITSRSKRVFSRRMWEKKEIRASLQDGSREWITLLACVCADGSTLPPSLIYQSAAGSIQSSWVIDVKPGEHSAHVTSSPSGWTNNDIGLAWLEQVFNRYTKKKAGRAYRLLIVDGMDLMLQWIFLSIATGKGLSWQSFLLIQLIRFSRLTLYYLDLSQLLTQLSYHPISTRARG